jgi:hypothetical protein
MKVFRDLFKRMGISALWYVGILIVVLIALQIIFNAVGIGEDMRIDVTDAFDNSTRIYMLVIGIVCPPVYLSHYLAAGVTRRQFAVGIFAAAALLSLCLEVLRVPLLIMDNEFSSLAVLVPMLGAVLAFLGGWTAVVGFQFMRGVPIIISIACASAMCYGVISIVELQLPTLAYMGIYIGAILAIGATLLAVVRRIPVRC